MRKREKKRRVPPPEHPQPKPTKSLRISSRTALIAVAVTGLVFSLFVYFYHLGHWHQHRDTLFYDGNLPLMTTMDAYYYLTLTSDLLQRGTNQTGMAHATAPVSLLATMTAFIAGSTKLPLERIAFFLPPVLGSLMIIVYGLWGYAAGGPMVALIASLAGSCSVSWYTRSCLGRFDTDCLNPFFLFLIIYFVYRYVIEWKPVRYAYLFSALLLAILFGLWWFQIVYIGFAVLFLTYALSLPLPSAKWEKYLKLSLITTAIAVLLVALSGHSNLFPSPFSQYLESSVEHFRLITKDTVSVFPDVGQSINELEVPSFREASKAVAGHAIPLLLSFVGLILLAIRNRGVALPLVAGFLFAFGSVFSRRFLIFAVPLYALGIGYLFGEVLFKSRYLAKIRSPIARFALVLMLAASALAPGFHRTMSTNIQPTLTAGDVALARAISRDSTPNGTIWAWWDRGYFLRYITGRKTFFDGGSQSPERTFVAAFPLSCTDKVLARNWIRYFSAHDMAGLHDLGVRVGGPEKAVTFLRVVLAKPDITESLLQQFGLKDLQINRDYLFPEVNSFLYLGRDTLDTAYWWYYFGTWDFQKREGIHPDMIKMGLSDPLQFERKPFVGITGKKLLRVDRVAYVNSGGVQVKETPGARFEESRGKEEAAISEELRSADTGWVAVQFEGVAYAYTMTPYLFESLAAELLAANPFHMLHFTPLAYEYRFGGVWRVE